MVSLTVEGAVLGLHILAGFVALIAGAVALVTEKGGDRHRQAGRFFVRSMAVVIVTVPVLFAFDPSDRFLQFLLIVAVFTGYLVFTGYRVLSRKRSSAGADSLDRLAAGLVLVVSLGLGGWGLVIGVGGAPLGFGMVVFAAGGVAASGAQLRDFRNPDRRNPWIADHLSQMIGGYIGTVTAVSVVNFNTVFPGLVPEVVAWIWPTVVGVPLIFYWQGKYANTGPFATAQD